MGARQRSAAGASRLRPGLPEAIDEVIARGLAKNPAMRFRSAAELARACAQALGGATDQVGPLGVTSWAMVQTRQAVRQRRRPSRSEFSAQVAL